MKNHFQRLLIVGALAAICLIALVVAATLSASDVVVTSLATALALLVPAVIDSVSVEKRRRTPGQKAVEDDVAPDQTTTE